MGKRVSASRAPSENTKNRILLAARQLFNSRGLAEVTTAHIAATLSISEGNLWYHFRSKRQLVMELFTELEEQALGTLAQRPGPGEGLDAFVGYLTESYRYMWEYRFLFRDRLPELQGDATLLKRHRALVRRSHRHLRSLLEAMRERDLLHASDDEVEALVINAWILHRYWIDYLQGRETLETLRPVHLRQGLTQMLALFQPHLAPGLFDVARSLTDQLELM